LILIDINRKIDLHTKDLTKMRTRNCLVNSSSRPVSCSSRPLVIGSYFAIFFARISERLRMSSRSLLHSSGDIASPVGSIQPVGLRQRSRRIAQRSDRAKTVRFSKWIVKTRSLRITRHDGAAGVGFFNRVYPVVGINGSSRGRRFVDSSAKGIVLEADYGNSPKYGRAYQASHVNSNQCRARMSFKETSRCR
jgi:hypothetical protein